MRNSLCRSKVVIRSDNCRKSTMEGPAVRSMDTTPNGLDRLHRRLSRQVRAHAFHYICMFFLRAMSIIHPHNNHHHNKESSPNHHHHHHHHHHHNKSYINQSQPLAGNDSALGGADASRSQGVPEHHLVVLLFSGGATALRAAAGARRP